jgi:hypothetical protein
MARRRAGRARRIVAQPMVDGLALPRQFMTIRTILVDTGTAAVSTTLRNNAGRGRDPRSTCARLRGGPGAFGKRAPARARNTIRAGATLDAIARGDAPPQDLT